MKRTLAIVEREMRRFRRSPFLIVMSMIFPLAQLVVLGYAFGGNVKHLKLAIVDQDHGVPAVRVREMTAAVASGAHTIDTVSYADVVATTTAAFKNTNYKLLERAAGAVADAILSHFPRIRAVKITVHKPHAPIAAIFDDVGIMLTRSRQP